MDFVTILPTHFVPYENTRSNIGGGGVAFSARKELRPDFVYDGGEEVEVITVDIHMKDISIGITSAYGPQESY